MDKPTTAAGYDGTQTELVRATCLYVATKLGDMADDLVIVGGLVPSLLVDQQKLPAGAQEHVGTMDLDVGLSVLLLEKEGLPEIWLAFQDRLSISLEGRTLFGESPKRTIQVCGPGAFVVLKALALRNRGENKDAYDLYYLIRNYGSGPVDVAERFAPLLSDAKAREALQHLKEDFEELDSIGPMRAATFITGGPDDEVQQDAFDFMRLFLSYLENT